ncbi:MAG: hypothetical protein ACKE51_01700 [Methylococcaceae bacterium]
MSEQHKKNKRIIIIIFAMSIVPFGIAWFLSSNASLMGPSINNGELISPPVTTEKSEFVGYDDFSIKNMKELAGHWVLVNVIPSDDCNLVCQEAIHKTKQLRLMMNKDLTRIRRVVLIIPDINADLAKQWWKDDLRLLRSKPAESLQLKLKKIMQDSIPDGILILMDPLGNLMMQYESGFDPYKVKRDLRKLLRISQIG